MAPTPDPVQLLCSTQVDSRAALTFPPGASAVAMDSAHDGTPKMLKRLRRSRKVAPSSSDPVPPSEPDGALLQAVRQDPYGDGLMVGEPAPTASEADQREATMEREHPLDDRDDEPQFDHPPEGQHPQEDQPQVDQQDRVDEQKPPDPEERVDEEGPPDQAELLVEPSAEFEPDDKAQKAELQRLASSLVDGVYQQMAALPLSKERITELLGKEFMEWLSHLQGALQIPWETVFFMLISMTSFQLFKTVAQYTNMLGVPPLPWLGVLGRPGEAKSIAIWFVKQVILELQKRGRGNRMSKMFTMPGDPML